MAFIKYLRVVFHSSSQHISNMYRKNLKKNCVWLSQILQNKRKPSSIPNLENYMTKVIIDQGIATNFIEPQLGGPEIYDHWK